MRTASRSERLVTPAPRPIAHPPIVRDVAQAIEAGFFSDTPMDHVVSEKELEDQIFDQCKTIIQGYVATEGITTEEAEEYERAAFETVGLLGMGRGTGDGEDKARCSYEAARKRIHGPGSKPTTTPESERIIREQREERCWDICQRLAESRSSIKEKSCLDIFWKAKSLEKTRLAQAVELFSKFAATADPSRLDSYVLNAFERLSLLHERAGRFAEALEVIARYEETAQKGSTTKSEMVTVQKRKARILAKSSRGPMLRP